MFKLKKLTRKVKTILADETLSFARTPRKFALKDWKNALIETKNAFKSKNITMLAAGIAYFLTFAVFPSIAALVAILSFAISEQQLTSAAAAFDDYLPGDIAYLISTQLKAAFEHPSSSAIIVVFGIVIALVSVSGAISNIIKATNTIYEAEETRRFITLRLMSAAFVGIVFVMTIIVVGLLVLNESFLMSIGMPAWVAWTILIVRWVIIAGIVTVGLAAFYRYAPNRTNRHWQWVTWGSLIATLLWLVGTTLFFIYARYLAHYTESYSVFAGIIVLMIWLNLTAFSVLLGAAINFKLENQTRAKTSF
ncbi:MAG: YihY/virulence factor BrkB family protein [Candidatus Microsaccharimonas sp.]